jgi:hypothetical protein
VRVRLACNGGAAADVPSRRRSLADAGGDDHSFGGPQTGFRVALRFRHSQSASILIPPHLQDTMRNTQLSL